MIEAPTATSHTRIDSGLRATFRTYRWLWVVLGAALTFHLVFIWRTSFTIEGRRHFVLADDAMISMRYARNLAHGHGLLWNAGQPPVEGITNPLWTVWMAVVHLLPMPDRLRSLPIMLSSSLLVLATIVNVTRVTALLSPRRLAPLAAAVLCATFYPFTYWALRGMEVGLLGFLTVTGLLLVLRDPSFDDSRTRLWFPILVAALITTRLDAVVPAAILCGAAVVLARPDRRRVVAIAGFGSAVATVVLETVARRAYYGAILPNTYYLKVSGIPLRVRVDHGWALLRGIGVTNFGTYVVLAAAAVVVACVRRDARFLPLTAIVAAAAFYSVWTGGDAFEHLGFANRFLSTAAPVLMILAGVGVAELVASNARLLRSRVVLLSGGLALTIWWMAKGGPRVPVVYRLGYVSVLRMTAPLAWVALGVAIAGGAAVVALSFIRRAGDAGSGAGNGRGLVWAGRLTVAVVVVLAAAAANEAQFRSWANHDVASFEQQMTRDGVRYRAATKPAAVIAFSAAGAAAYFSNRRAVDLLGLNDAHIAREPPRAAIVHPGHDKFDYAYSLGHLRPDLVARTFPVPHVAGYRVVNLNFEEVRIGSPNVDLRLLRRPSAK